MLPEGKRRIVEITGIKGGILQVVQGTESTVASQRVVWGGREITDPEEIKAVIEKDRNEVGTGLGIGGVRGGI